MPVGDNEVYRNIVAVGLDFIFVKELKIVADANSESFRTGEQTVVESFSSANAIAAAIVSHSRYDYKVHVCYIGGVVAVGLFDVECAQMGVRP